ncbi:hypothetical protein [uncultured Desulfovibrio sp.]|uniref:hypothetical protein n=1 Tax=uncultured Desulfovibrio sp. TaxID=167968 RepID=UPI002626FDA0|nr:hypothetical protein [uncultured Desulfovibrio sp.]
MKAGRPVPGAPFLCAVLCALAVCMAGGCGRRAPALTPPPASNGLPRADPGYLQWLERQSMLGRVPELAAQVSGTERLWHNSSTARRVPVLLRAAPNWLALDARVLASGTPLFRALHSARLPERLPALGLEGLFLAPVGEQGDVWTARSAAGGQPRGRAATAAASFMPDPAWGSGEDFARLAEMAEAAGVQTGGELPPAATGLGPDFMLQARQAPRFGGVYAMISVPREAWGDLPEAAEEWDCRPLEPEAVARLADRGLLPPALMRDRLAWAAPSGWAATGEVRGVDGQLRRWVYRHGPAVLRPVLHWQDPGGQARRIFSAASILQTGLEGQTLTGLRFEALMGLDVPPAEGASGGDGSAPDRAALTPGLEALDEAAREIHRYGGWAMQADALPAALAPLVLDGPVDVTRDAATPAAAARALREGDAAPLAAALRAALDAGIEQRRCARGPDAPGGFASGTRGDTAASLALRALGLPARIPAGAGERRALRDACLFLLGWRIGLPGLAFFSPAELAGALPPEGGGDGVTPVWDETPGRAGAAPPMPLAFGALAEQEGDDGSFLRAVSRLLLARKATGLALGELVAVSGGRDGWVATVSSLPEGGMWLVVGNASPRRRALSVPLPRPARSARDAAPDASGRAPRLAAGGRAVEVELDGRQCRHVLLEKQ